MELSCNSCGAFENLKSCSHCPTTLCNRCRHHHESVCEENQKKKKRGQGPTIFPGHLIEIPTVHPKSDVERGLAAIADLLHESN